MSDDDPSKIDDVGDEGEDGEYPFLKAKHPLLERVQKSLFDQLSRQNERVSLALREKQQELRNLTKHREDVGVTLYGQQQQLAKLQLNLERLHDEFAQANKTRLDEEAALTDCTTQYEQRRKDVDDASRRLTKSQAELSQLGVTLRQVEEYNEKMKAEINVTRRATYKAEDNIKDVEKAKLKQDLLIDSMNEDIKRLSEQKALFDAQLIAQRQETEAARSTLVEASREMEGIEFEKKQLMQQWRSSIIGMQRRDEALQNVDAALRQQSEDEMALDSEIRGVQNSIRQEQENNEKLTGLLQKNETEVQHLQSQMQQIRAEREKLTEQYGMLKKSLEHTQEESAKLDVSIKEKETALELVEKTVQKVSRETTALNDKIYDIISDQTTIKRSEDNTRKVAGKIGSDIDEKEMELQNLLNEIARVKVDSLNTKGHNQMLKDRLKQFSQDLADREKLIDQYELEIRKRLHQIQKKQLYVDRLNREYAEKVAKQEDDSTGPLEAKIKNLRKQIADRTAESLEMQKEWIKKQTELMSIQTNTDQCKAVIADQKNRKLILDQKKVRIEGQLEAHHKEISELNNAVKQLRFEMDKLNGQLAVYARKQDDLKNQNDNLETEFASKLREVEDECKALDANVDAVKSQKAQMQEEIIEAERQVMLWERKIHLEREMQEALDPEVGQVEAQAMKKEIHRMDLRFDQLKRRQEQMILEMERVIHKRDAIQLKYEPKAKTNKAANTQINVRRQIASLKSGLRGCSQANTEVDQRMQERERELAELQERIEKAVEETTQFEQHAEQLASNVNVGIVAKAENFATTVRFQKMGKRYEEMRDGVPLQLPPLPQLRAQKAEDDERRQKLTETLQALQESFPHLEALWGAFLDWLEAARA